MQSGEADTEQSKEEQLKDSPDDSNSGEVVESFEEGSSGESSEPETGDNSVPYGSSKQDYSQEKRRTADAVQPKRAPIVYLHDDLQENSFKEGNDEEWLDREEFCKQYELE